MRQAEVYFRDTLAGMLIEEDDAYRFVYEQAYIDNPKNLPVSLTLPIRREPYSSKTIFSFFDGLIPEGWLLDITVETWKLNSQDRMGLLLVCCEDGIGAVSILPIQDLSYE